MINLKKKTDGWFLPIVKILAKWEVHPNVLTIFAFCFGMLAVLFLFHPGWFVIFAALHLLLDKLDGVLARFTKKTSVVGRWLDHGSDRIVELLLLVRLFQFSPFMPWVLGVSIVHNLLYFVVERMFYGRTLIMIFVAFRWYELAVVCAAVVYLFGLLVQLKEILLNSKKVLR